MLHKNKYNYDIVNYLGNKTDINITCIKHGVFKQSPQNHLKGFGCPSCSGLKKSTTKEFIIKAKKIHKNYDYSLVEYKNTNTKVKIICIEHGVFKQTPHYHLYGNKCPKCIISNSKNENLIKDILLKNKVNYQPQYSFTDLRYKKPLYFDFGILDDDNNLKYLIEYNGEQHYNFVNYGEKSKDEFEILKYRDELKINYCFSKNIPLYIIKYTESVLEKTNHILKNNKTK